MTNLIFRRLHGNSQVMDLFEDSAMIQSMLDVECVLAYGLAELKICKQSHSKSIAKKCKVSNFDLFRLAEAAVLRKIFATIRRVYFWMHTHGVCQE